MHIVSRRVLRVSRVVPSLVRRKTGSSGLTGTEPKSVKHLRLAFVNMAPSPLNLLLLGAVLSQSTASVISPRQRVPDGFVAKSVYPTPHGGWDRDWVDSYERAKAIVDQMTLAEKTNITSGSGWWMDQDVVSATLAAPLALGSLNSAWDVAAAYGNVIVVVQTVGPILVEEWIDLPSVKSVLFQHLPGQEAGESLTNILFGNVSPSGHLPYSITRREEDLPESGVNVWLGPSVGPLGRKPKGGRNWEGFGSDPVLQAKAGALSIKGVQEQGVIATIKHLIGNEQEMYRMYNPLQQGLSANIDDRTLHEIYLWPFAEGIRAGSGAVMTAYNAVNGSASVHNSQMINGVLKNELGFQGFVMSDWFSQMSGVDAAIAGLDMAMPGDTQVPLFGYSYWMYDLTRSVLNGSVPMDRLNDMTTRIVATWIKFGQDKGFPKVNFHLLSNDAVGDLYQAAWPFSPRGVINEFVQVQADHNLVAREVAQDAITLLKNNGSLLPIATSRSIKLTGGSTGQPQDTFSEGLYIDYRYLNKNGIKPRFPFGHGLSYTSFNFTNPSISAVTQLSRTPPAPPSRAPVLNFNQAIHPWQQGVVPAGFSRIFRYLYSWCTEGEAKQAVRDREDGKKYPYPPGYTTVQPSAVPASGASGGNPRLFDVAFRVSVTVRNTGATHTGRASVQAYVQFPDGGPETPIVQLRDFEKTSRLAPGGSQVVTLALTRKDLSIWDVVSQNWIVPSPGGRYKIWIGDASDRLFTACYTDTGRCESGLQSPV
ncbi:hypothetical protein BN1723_005546 [Verticillium longisporum]|uniref:Beta-glucosidase cel3A n=1 Tax=Verticillium longisporum TaxID=100787 RepID=A0A0G4NA55_VERLO|nr:hypothetical protein BN1723_005546 [Verticillium longisporum]